jgi:hypothetical protein
MVRVEEGLQRCTQATNRRGTLRPCLTVLLVMFRDAHVFVRCAGSFRFVPEMRRVTSAHAGRLIPDANPTAR